MLKIAANDSKYFIGLGLISPAFDVHVLPTFVPIF